MQNVDLEWKILTLRFEEYCLPAARWRGAKPPPGEGAAPLGLWLVESGHWQLPGPEGGAGGPENPGPAGPEAADFGAPDFEAAGLEPADETDELLAIDKLADFGEDGGNAWAGAAGAAPVAGPGEVVAAPLARLGNAQALWAGAGGCALLGLSLAGTAPAGFAAGLSGAVCFGHGCGEQAHTLWEGFGTLPPHRASALSYELLCGLASAGARAENPLVAAALAQIREHYAEVYGVEELAAQLGVSKSHLIRRFTAVMGAPPGKYLTSVRVQNAKRLLAAGLGLEVVASLCGFSGANYLCKVFKKETGETPRAWRERNAQSAGAAPALEAELYL